MRAPVDRRTFIKATTGAASASLAAQTAGADPLTVFERKTQGYINIRIPTIVKTTKGSLLAFAEGRVGGDAGKIHTILRRSEDDGRTWSDLQIVWQDDSNTCGNPAPIVDRDTGTIWLFLTWNLGSDHEGHIMKGTSTFPRKVFLCKSNDDGKTWSTPVEMPHLRKDDWLWYATGPVSGIQLTRGSHKGRLICPANHSRPASGSTSYRSHIIYSDDHGKTWALGGVQDILTNESTVVELDDGSVMQNMRSYHGKGNRAVAVSRDGGKTFEERYLDDGLTSPVCQASILRWSWKGDDKGCILFSSPTGPDRAGMTIRASYDDGKTWAASTLIHKGGSAYSNLVKLSDKMVGLLYEKDNCATIEFVTVPISDIK